MSLMSRVEMAQGVVAQRSSADDTGFLGLRKQVQALLPSEQIAELAAASPSRARSEVRRACLEVLSGVEWDVVDEAKREELIGEVIDSMFGFGPLEELISDESVTEIMVNGPNLVFYERAGKLYPSTQQFASEDQLRTLIDRILGPLGRRVDESSPIADARLPQGHRVHVVMPPISLMGPTVSIRKFSTQVLTLEDLAAKGSFGPDVIAFLTWAVRLRKNIAVSGGTGSGKTTLLNALSCVIPPDERIITIEDSAELRFKTHPHVVPFEARPENAEGKGSISIRDLVISALRMRPDRIVVGECRGAEALDMLQAMSTGHDGSLTTLHANTPEEVVARLTTMVRYSADLPVDVVEANIANALDLVVQTARAPDGSRYLSHISELGYDAQRRKCTCTALYSRGPFERSGHWERMPDWLGDVVGYGLAGPEEVKRWQRKR